MIFAKFQGEAPGLDQAPSWADGLFDPSLPGSFAHFYGEMSGGKLKVEGEVLPRRYSSRQPAPAYLAEQPGELGKFGRFNLEIIEQADADVDLGRFDNDGPDGLPNSGDDDGYVDVLFVNLLTVPRGFFLGGATGFASLGLETDYVSDDPAANGGFIRIRGRYSGFGGTTQRGHVFSVTSATMCHEFGHVLGLPDLFDQSSVTAGGEIDPEEDSAGIGKWGLMGLGTLGWGVEDGPNAFCAWSLAQLGWVEVVEIRESVRGLVVEDIFEGRKVYKIPLTRDEYFLLENRQASGSYYNRNIPAGGLLIWHVDERADNDEERHKKVDLVCADGLFSGRNASAGRPDPVAGRDDLDYWARDSAYAEAHGGNQGDATDPFDGVRFTRFAYDTNPRLSAYTGFRQSLSMGIAVDRIRTEGGRMIVDVIVGKPLAGHVARDATWSGKVDLSGDLVIDPGVKLTLAPGTELRFAPTDPYRRGFDTLSCEILVYGKLDLPDASEAPVVLTSSQPGGRWAGLFLMDGQRVDPEQVELRNSRYGVVRFRLPPGQTRWSGLQRVPVDLVVPEESELVIEPGTVVQFGMDAGRRGVSPALVELIVEGRVSAEGSRSDPVRFAPDPLEKDAFWYGLRLRPGGQIGARFLRLEGAGFGFSGTVSSGGRFRLEDSWIKGCGGGLRLALEGEAVVERTLFARNLGQAVRAERNGRLVLRDVKIAENGQEGIFLGNASLEGDSVTVERNGLLDPEDPRPGLKAVGGHGQRIELRDSRVARNTLHGLDLSGWRGGVVLRACEVSGNQKDGLVGRGVERALLDDVAATGNVGRGAAFEEGGVEIEESRFGGNVRAGLSLKSVSGSVERNFFQEGRGLEIEDADSLQVRDNRFENHSLALVCRNASPRIEGNRFLDNQTAIQVRGAPVPSLVRRNSFVGNQTAVENLSPLALPARENYWGTTDRSAIAGMIVGPVEWTPFLDREPDSTEVGAEEGGRPLRFALYPVYPNPFNSRAVLSFDIARPVRVELWVYDLLGQPVRRLMDARLEPGSYQKVWDGRSDAGRRTASGLYFFRLEAGRFAQTRTAVLVR